MVGPSKTCAPLALASSLSRPPTCSSSSVSQVLLEQLYKYKGSKRLGHRGKSESRGRHWGHPKSEEKGCSEVAQRQYARNQFLISKIFVGTFVLSRFKSQ